MGFVVWAHICMIFQFLAQGMIFCVKLCRIFRLATYLVIFLWHFSYYHSLVPDTDIIRKSCYLLRWWVLVVWACKCTNLTFWQTEWFSGSIYSHKIVTIKHIFVGLESLLNTLIHLLYEGPSGNPVPLVKDKGENERDCVEKYLTEWSEDKYRK